MKDKTENKKYRNRLIFLFLLLIILVFITSCILIVRVGNFSPLDTDTVFLIEKKLDMTVSGEKEVWDNKTSIDIFDVSFTNNNEKVVVKGEDSKKVIAPGTHNSYEFNLKNTGNIPVEYSVKMNATLKINNQEKNFDDFPILIKIKKYNEEYLLGSKEEWVSIENLINFKDNDILGVNNYSYYTFDWKWDFDGNDEIDTLLGTMAKDNDIDLIIDIKTSAEATESIDEDGGIPVFKEETEQEIGGTIKKGPFIIVILLIIITTCLIIKNYRNYKNNKNN